MPKIVISEDVHKSVLKIISKWKGKLTWKLLCERVTRENGLDKEVSRHTLLAYGDIEIAYNERKKALKDEPAHLLLPEDKQLENAYEQIDELKADKKVLQGEVKAMREQVVRWMYNLYQMGLNMDEMNKALPPSVDLEELRGMKLPPNVDAEKLNQPLPKITRADDNKRKRSRYDPKK
ncbi:hypothetical protein A9Q98_09705 [Thalassotalea sp. 42_200_T64]|nr:hypothetical protein A9Q98_09705 [Thalassotalea sp. 42_200_T64]